MNLQDQIGAIDVGVDQLIQAASAAPAPAAADAAAPQSTDTAKYTPAHLIAPDMAIAAVDHAQPEALEAESEATAPADAPASDARATLEVGRPSQNEITMTIGGQTVALRAEQIGQLIEELSNARASMTPEPPPGIPTGWRFVSTKNPVMAVQKQSNGDRLLVMRHTGHGWVPFTFSPDMVIQLYMMLTKG